MSKNTRPIQKAWPISPSARPSGVIKPQSSPRVTTVVIDGKQQNANVNTLFTTPSHPVNKK